MSFTGNAIAKSQGSAEALAILLVLQEILSEAQQALPQVQTRLEETSDTCQAIAFSPLKFAKSIIYWKQKSVRQL